jgi:hypothetical protein
VPGTEEIGAMGLEIYTMAVLREKSPNRTQAFMFSIRITLALIPADLINNNN